MRKIILILILLLPMLMMATRYDVQVQQSGSYISIIGTSYYLQIIGFLSYGYQDAILDTGAKTLKVRQSSYYNQEPKYTTYYYMNAYEKVNLPAGTLSDTGMLVWTVYVPTTIK